MKKREEGKRGILLTIQSPLFKILAQFCICLCVKIALAALLVYVRQLLQRVFVCYKKNTYPC